MRRGRSRGVMSRSCRKTGARRTTIIATSAAQTPRTEGQAEWASGHMPMAMPIPSGRATRSTTKTNRTTASFLATIASLALERLLGARGRRGPFQLVSW